jgi:UDP-hydrolysing UDP-N-acetyl-D-glucosamine 2-epimerase
LRTIGVVTTARSDYGILAPVMRAIESDPALRLRTIAGGMHLAAEFGMTVEAIERDGFTIADRVEMLLSSDSPSGVAKSMGLGVIAFAESYARARPDILVALGDRFEMHAAVSAALPFKMPVAHIHGGELTAGAIDDALRHGITKMSHLHFASTAGHARRVIQLGEEPWRVTVSGAPSLDQLGAISLLDSAALERRFGVPFSPSPLIVTFHPATLQSEQTPAQVDELLAALETAGLPIVFTLPNADTGGRVIRERIVAYAAAHPKAYVLDNLGTQAYFSVMALSTAMVGNSSSGIIEAASFKLPVVNVGLRQAGRERAANVIDVGESRTEILAGIRRGTDPAFRASLADLVNPYGRGDAAATIVERLASVPIDDRLLIKRFHDLPVTELAHA